MSCPVNKTKCLLQHCNQVARYKPGYCKTHLRQGLHYGFIGEQIACPTEGCLYFVAAAGKCLNCYAQSQRQRQTAKDYIKRYNDEYRARPGVHQRNKECSAQWRAENIEYIKKQRSTDEARRVSAAVSAQRRAQKLKATPKWSDLDAIRRFYAACPPGYHVDHVVPLKGKQVSGLHVIWNLQYLPAAENLSKGNRFNG